MGLSIWRRALTTTATLAALLTAASAAAADYTVLITGRPSGAMSVTGDAARRQVAFAFNDRGRGSDLKSEVVVGADGAPVSLKVSGVDYLKAPVSETYADGRWSSQADEGAASAPGFYVPFQATPEDGAILTRALIKDPDQTIPLLPAGEARLRKILDTEVKSGGPRRAVSLYTVSGLGLTPQPIWLTADGELFFGGGSWSGVILKGWEADAPDLVRIQDAALKDSTRAAAKRLGARPAGPVFIKNANLFDARSRTMRPGSSVLVRGQRIEQVWPGAEGEAPQGALVIDAQGRALLPGLWDMHVHISDDSEGFLNLAAGVTSVRDLANDIEELAARKAAFDSGELLGPRIYRAGIIDGAGPLAAPTKVLVSTPQEMRAAVNRYADLGYEQVKLYSALKPELVPVAVEAAHARGLRVSGHIPAGMLTHEAVDAGYDELQHINFVFLNFMGKDVARQTASPTRFTAVGKDGMKLDLKSAEVRAFIAKLKDHHVVVDPTLATFEDMFKGGPRMIAPNMAAVIDRLPPTVARGFKGGGLAKTDEERAAYRASYANMVRMVGELHRAGVHIVPGTDAFAGFILHRELELWAEAGVPNTDILYLATLGSAEVGKHDKDLGSIEAGKLADLVIIDGDPSRNISDIRKTAVVIKDGVVLDPKLLYAEVGIAP